MDGWRQSSACGDWTHVNNYFKEQRILKLILVLYSLKIENKIIWCLWTLKGLYFTLDIHRFRGY